MSITRFAWIDDDGSGTTGTVINNAELQKIFDAVDGAIPTVVAAKRGATTPDVVNNFLSTAMMVGLSPFDEVTLEIEFYRESGAVPDVLIYFISEPGGAVLVVNLATVGGPFNGAKMARVRMRPHPATNAVVFYEVWAGDVGVVASGSYAGVVAFAGGGQWTVAWNITLQCSAISLPLYYNATVRRSRIPAAVGLSAGEVAPLPETP